MIALATKKLVLIAIFSMQFNMVLSIYSRQFLRNHETREILHQKSAALHFQKASTAQYLITGPLAEQLRAKFGFLFDRSQSDEDLDALRREFRFLFQSMNVPDDKLKLLGQTQQRYNKQYAAKIARLSKYFLRPAIVF